MYPNVHRNLSNCNRSKVPLCYWFMCSVCSKQFALPTELLSYNNTEVLYFRYVVKNILNMWINGWWQQKVERLRGSWGKNKSVNTYILFSKTPVRHVLTFYTYVTSSINNGCIPFRGGSARNLSQWNVLLAHVTNPPLMLFVTPEHFLLWLVKMPPERHIVTFTLNGWRYSLGEIVSTNHRRIAAKPPSLAGTSK